jgi:hypothetical protein
VYCATPALTFASWRSVTIAVWRSAPTAAAIQRIDGYVTRLLQSYSHLSSMIVIEPTEFAPPDRAAREEHARLTLKHDNISRGIATVIEGKNAKASIYRFAITTVQLMSSPQVPHNTFSSVPSAANWLATMDPNLDPQAIVTPAGEARQLLPTRPATP